MDKFTAVQNEHLVLTQFYRWYQVYEVDFTPATIRNQLDILTDDVAITSAAGTTNGKALLPDRLKIYEGWQNAHHILNTEIKFEDHGNASLEADILYQNIRPDNSKHSYQIHYSTNLLLKGQDLPLFKSVKLEPTETIADPIFEPSYATNRAKSFMHYWLFLMETIATNKEKFEELLSNTFELNFSTGDKIDSLEKFYDWAENASAQVKASGHFPKNILIKENANQTIQVSADFEWQGISIDDKPMIAETHHEWILENNIAERFARMKKMTVTQTVAFQLVGD